MYCCFLLPAVQAAPLTSSFSGIAAEHGTKLYKLALCAALGRMLCREIGKMNPGAGLWWFHGGNGLGGNGCCVRTTCCCRKTLPEHFTVCPFQTSGAVNGVPGRNSLNEESWSLLNQSTCLNKLSYQ